MLEFSERIESRYEVIDKIVTIGEFQDGIFFQVQWEGLPDKRDYTWEPIEQLYTDLPDRVTEFLKTFKYKKRIVNKAKSQLSIS